MTERNGSLAHEITRTGSPRADAAAAVLRYAPDATPGEVGELLDRYERDARNLTAYTSSKGRKGILAEDLKEIRAQQERTRAGQVIDEVRRSGEPCEHGAPGGLHAHPTTGKPMCPQCRREGRQAIKESPAAAPADPGVETAQGRRIRLIPASAITPRPVLWGWEGRLPLGALSLIPGREGIGKSLFLIWLTAMLTRGTLPGEHSGESRPVLYCASEDSWAHTIVPRLIAAGADLDCVFRVAVEEPESGAAVQLYLPRDCGALAREIKDVGVAMLALDPLMSVLDPAIDTHSDRELRTALEPLARIAEETECMVVGLAHFNKSASDDPLSLVTGSRAFTAVVRAVIAIARDPEADDGSCVASQVKNNLGRLDLPSLRYVVRSARIETPTGTAETGRLIITGETAKSVRDILADSVMTTDRSDRAECADWLRGELAKACRPTKELLDEAVNEHGFSKRTFERARKSVGAIAVQRPGPNGRNMWWLRPPDAEQTATDQTAS